jgi:hypothetical protein
MSKKKNADDPIAQQLKVVQVLRCVSGYARQPVDGAPIAIVTLAHNGEVEQPMLLYLDEAEKLAFRLMAVLDYHGNDLAKKIVADHLRPRLDADHGAT